VNLKQIAEQLENNTALPRRGKLILARCFNAVNQSSWLRLRRVSDD